MKMRLAITLSIIFFMMNYAYGEEKSVPQTITDTKIFKKVDNFLGKETTEFLAIINVAGKVQKKETGLFKNLDGKKYEIYVKINKEKSKVLSVTPDEFFKMIFYVDGLKLNGDDRINFAIYHDDIRDKIIYEKEFLLDDEDFRFEFKTLEVEIEFKERD